jgi:hypothetical protein
MLCPYTLSDMTFRPPLIEEINNGFFEKNPPYRGFDDRGF